MAATFPLTLTFSLFTLGTKRGHFVSHFVSVFALSAEDYQPKNLISFKVLA